MTERMDFADGKYTVINENGKLTALRHGEPWNRDITGDNLIYWMLVEAVRLKEERDELAAKLKELEGQKPVAWAVKNGWVIEGVKHSENSRARKLRNYRKATTFPGRSLRIASNPSTPVPSRPRRSGECAAAGCAARAAAVPEQST